jgi:hypothetical protein
MKISIPKFQPATAKTNNPLISIVEIFWHTIIPVILIYLMMKYNQPLLFLPIIFILFVRVKSDDFRRKD